MTAPEASAAPRRVTILGAGPIGLDAALACAERGWPFTVFEAGDRVGGNVRTWGHVRLFTPWSMNVSPRMRDALDRAGIAVPTGCLLYTSPSPRDRTRSRMPSSA